MLILIDVRFLREREGVTTIPMSIAGYTSSSTFPSSSNQVSQVHTFFEAIS